MKMNTQRSNTKEKKNSNTTATTTTTTEQEEKYIGTKYKEMRWKNGGAPIHLNHLDFNVQNYWRSRREWRERRRSTEHSCMQCKYNMNVFVCEILYHMWYPVATAIQTKWHRLQTLTYWITCVVFFCFFLLHSLIPSLVSIGVSGYHSQSSLLTAINDKYREKMNPSIWMQHILCMHAQAQLSHIPCRLTRFKNEVTQVKNCTRSTRSDNIFFIRIQTWRGFVWNHSMILAT